MAHSDSQVIGICRWSYPSDGRDFATAADTTDATREKLYARPRLEHRLFLLEHVMLPGLRAQTDPDFLFILLAGDRLPDWARSRIEALVADLPQVQTVFAPEGQNVTDVARAEIRARRDPDVAACLEFRLDDDDAVGAEFVEQSRALYDESRAIFQRTGRFALDFSRGFVMSTTPTACSFRPIATRFWTPGLLTFLRPSDESCVLDFHHLRLWHAMPTMIWVDKPMFIRGVHHDNDSNIENVGRRTRGFRFSDGQMRRHLNRRFGIDMDRIAETWAAEAPRFFETA